MFWWTNICKNQQVTEWMWGGNISRILIWRGFCRVGSSPKHRHGSTHARISPQLPRPQEWNRSPIQIFKPYAQCRQGGRRRRRISLCDRSFPLVQRSKLEIFELHSFRCHYCKVTAEPAWVSEWVSERGPSALVFHNLCSSCHLCT